MIVALFAVLDEGYFADQGPQGENLCARSETKAAGLDFFTASEHSRGKDYRKYRN